MIKSTLNVKLSSGFHEKKFNPFEAFQQPWYTKTGFCECSPFDKCFQLSFEDQDENLEIRGFDAKPFKN